MTSYQQLQAQFAQTVKDCLSTAAQITLREYATATMTPSLNTLIDNLIDNLPYYGQLEFEQTHRRALANLLEWYMPNSGIAARPNDSGFGYFTSYSYNGPYSGYQNAFYQGVTLSPTANAVLTQVQNAQPNLTSSWWGSFGVTVLTDAVRQAISPSLDTSKLSIDLSSGNAALQKGLAASYLAVFSTGYKPTADALATIINAGQGATSANMLATALTQGQFTPNINHAISMGGDSSNAVVWFLFNLWITLKALGAGNVDTIIGQCQSAGLKVPQEVAAINWWNGGYTSWFSAFGGSDVNAEATATINADMPESSTTSSGPPMPPVSSNQTEPHGYSVSLCNWGGLNWYNPPSSSCFGRGTQVLMADGSRKAIETIRIGDEVQSNLGARKVVLVETPKRLGRALYQLNGLAVFATSAHPFRAADSAQGMRMAVDAWALIDSVPSMIKSGVATLREGVKLAAWINGKVDQASITRIIEHQATDADERVYDLLLQDWTEDHAAYYVGGPDCFFAVDAETADPAYDLQCSIAIATAMHATIDICRKTFPRPEVEMVNTIASLRTVDIFAVAVNETTGEGNLNLQNIPNTEFFLRNGAWDYHASLLEAQLVRCYARAIRRHLHDPLNGAASANNGSSHFGISLRDIELLGEHGIHPGAILSLELRLRGWGTDEDRVRMIELGADRAPRWFITMDSLVDFDCIPPTQGSAAILGSLLADGKRLGNFRFNVELPTAARVTREHFLYSDDCAIIGRLACDEVCIGDQQVALIEMRGRQSSTTKAVVKAISLGERLGQQIQESSVAAWK